MDQTTRAIEYCRQLNQDINWMKQAEKFEFDDTEDEFTAKWYDGVKYYFKYFKFDWDRKIYVAVLEPENSEYVKSLTLEEKILDLTLDQLKSYALQFRSQCVLLDVDTFMQEYVSTLTYPDDSINEKYVQTMIAEINARLDKLFDIGDFCGEEELDVQLGGMRYQVLEVLFGVQRLHEHSDAVATAVCQQVPSADEYLIEVSQVWVEEFLGTVRRVSSRLGLDNEQK